MKTSTTSADLPCTPDTLWASFFDESYLRALYLDELQYRSFAVLEIGDTSRKVRIEASGEGHCRRTDRFSVEAKIFGLGGLIESSIEKELQGARAKECAFLRRWVERPGI